MTEEKSTLFGGHQSLAGRRVLIFGGTSGIGLATALMAKEAGAHVIIAGSDRVRTQNVQQEYGFSDALVADVTDIDAVGLALLNAPEIDHLVILSGTFVVGTVLDGDLSVFRRAFDERLWGAVHIIRHLEFTENASITLVSGALADRPNGDGTAIIAAACAAMETFGRGLALELAPVRVNTVAPGPINTPLLSKSLGEGRDAFVAQIERKIPIGRIGTADEAASAILFLMTNQFMNGATLSIDGGMKLI